MGVTQASVSNYARKARGVMIDLENDPTVAKAADKVAEMLSGEKPNKMAALEMMTQLCDYIRFNHLMCSLHKDLEPGFSVEGCEACSGVFSGKDFERLKVVVGQ
jgi:predicted transcriptional regulator